MIAIWKGAGPLSSEDVNEDEGAFLVIESCVTLANIGITPQVEGGELNQSGDIFSKEIDIPIDLSIPIKERLIDSAHNYHRPSVIRNPSPGIIYPHSTSSVVINLRSEYYQSFNTISIGIFFHNRILQLLHQLRHRIQDL